jgi:hypothetical protein
MGTDRVDQAAMDAALANLDVDTLTLGEMAAAEAESGQPFSQILQVAIRGGATRRLLALWLWERRNSAKPRSWRELADLRPSARSSSTS